LAPPDFASGLNLPPNSNAPDFASGLNLSPNSNAPDFASGLNPPFDPTILFPAEFGLCILPKKLPEITRISKVVLERKL